MIVPSVQDILNNAVARCMHVLVMSPSLNFIAIPIIDTKFSTKQSVLKLDLAMVSYYNNIS